MKGPTPSALQRGDGLWIPTLDEHTMPMMFNTEEAALSAARQRLHSWWHRADALVTTETAMATCEECRSATTMGESAKGDSK